VHTRQLFRHSRKLAMASYPVKVLFDTLIMGSDIATCGAFLAVMYRMKASKSASGISLQSIGAIFTLRVLHACSHMWTIHYVPKAMPMFLFKFTDFAVVLSGGFCVVSILTAYYSSYEVEKDNFGIQLFDKFGILPDLGTGRFRPFVAASVLYSFAAVLSVIWYMIRTANSYNLTTYTCFNEALSAVALLPQLWMFRSDKRVDTNLATFVVAVAVNRMCTLLFWTFLPFLVVHKWAVPTNRGIQMGLEIINLIILADFLYYWVRAKLRGETEIILGGDCGV
jgi:hypothetical protein